MALTSIMRRTIGPLTLQLDNSPTDVVIELRRQHVLVDMSIVSIHVDIPPAESVNDLARNAMLVAAACLSKLGRPDAAADLVAICRDAPLLVSEELALVLAGSFAEARRWLDAIDLVSDGSRASFAEPFATLLLTTLMLGPGIRPDEAGYVASGLVRRGVLVAAQGEAQAAGANLYSAGNMLFHVARDYETALWAYERAGDLAPDYEQRAYYCAERAAAYFENGRYLESVQWYEAAQRLDPNDLSLLAKLADAYTYHGDYRTAADLMERYAAGPADEQSSLWLFHEFALSSLMRVTQLERQRRGPEAALRRHTEGDDPAAAWQLDALCPSAWAELLSDSDDDQTLDALLVLCAYHSGQSAALWPHLLLAAARRGERELFALTMDIAWFVRGEELVEDMVDALAGLEQPLRSTLAADFDADIQRLREKREPARVRFLAEDGGPEVFEIALEQ